MECNIAISHFSFKHSHVANLCEIDAELNAISEFIASIEYQGVKFQIANDFFDDTGYGFSIREQINKLSKNDPQILGVYQAKLYQTYFRKNSFEFDNQNLKSRTLMKPCNKSNKSFIAYIPFLIMNGQVQSFKDINGLNNHYDYLLSYYPNSNKSYYKRAESRFKNLIFHENCGSTLDNINAKDGKFCDFSISFTSCLKALNNFSPTELKGAKDNIKIIKTLTEFDCTEEGSTHSKFKFDFTYSGISKIGINCEYHLKPSNNNTIGDDTFYQNRLYFGFFPIDEKLSRIAVASIGPHL